ncbi:MAG TPA: IPExxxVDY family protein [Chitinophagaceae bacterium]|nr:IPExxxVDY family protein [Chitinophagaceae bacterium]
MKFKLDTEGMEEEFFEDTRLLGIVAPVKDYLFCWHLNQLFRFQFRINNNIEIQLTKKRRNYFFAVYEYNEPHSSLIHYLYNNQHDGEYLLPEFKHLDFLWLMKGDLVSDEAFSSMAGSIKDINGVQLVMELTNEKIKNKGHLIF